jgi:hypothetical protein
MLLEPLMILLLQRSQFMPGIGNGLSQFFTPCRYALLHPKEFPNLFVGRSTQFTEAWSKVSIHVPAFLVTPHTHPIVMWQARNTKPIITPKTQITLTLERLGRFKDFFSRLGKIPAGSGKSDFQKYRKYRPKYR